VRAQGGVALWTNRYNGPGNSADAAYAIASDRDGNVFVTGDVWNGTSYDYATIKYSNTGIPLWTNLYNGPGDSRDVAYAIAVDDTGNIFVTGESWSSRADNSRDFATIAYSNSGLSLWTNRYDGPANSRDQAIALAVDSSGNVLVTGESANNTSSPYDRDYATIAYSNAGVPLWTNRYGGPGHGDDSPLAIAVDRSGNAFVTGVSRDSSGTNSDYATVAYSSAGELQWTRLYGGPGNSNDFAAAIAVDSSGNVFVTGGAYVGSSRDYATIKYSNSGIPLWTNYYNGPGNQTDNATALALDSNGNLFVTGVSFESSGGQNPDYATIKYSNSGVPSWTNRYNGPQNAFDQANAVVVDRGGNVFVTGSSLVFGGTDYDYLTVAYSNTGLPLWTNRYNGPADRQDSPESIAVDGDGNVFVTGLSTGSSAGGDYLTIKYSSSVPPPAHLDFQRLDNELVLRWTNTGFRLQSAPLIPGMFTNLLGTTSPYTNNLLTDPQQFFRLIAN
jgi:hypothetical protein